MKPSPRGTSLVARLVLLFVAGSAFIMAGAGYALYHALRMQLEAQSAAEIDGKSEVVQHILADVSGHDSLMENLGRLRDISIGHPHLVIGVHYDGRWLVAPPDDVLRGRERKVQNHGGEPSTEIEAGDRTWLVRTIKHSWDKTPQGQVQVMVAVETTDIRSLLADHAAIATVVALLGTLASALLAWFVARRGIAPLGHLAERAEQVTAQQLGSRLNVKEAPREVHGLADSINRMLERLEQSFRTLEQFSADIAHELRTPLNNLLLQTQVTLSRPRTTEEYQDALHNNLQEIEGLQRMISEMLFLARADRGMLEVEREDIDVALEARSVAEYFEAAASERRETIAVSGEANLHGDRLLLKRALTNLLSNAVRYSPDGSNIAVRISRTETSVTVTVSNPSEPIAPEELKRLFTRFARREESRTRSREGVGLGLAIVESIMKMQGGSVDAQWREGQIVFSLHFPVEKPSQTNPNASALSA